MHRLIFVLILFVAAGLFHVYSQENSQKSAPALSKNQPLVKVISGSTTSSSQSLAHPAQVINLEEGAAKKPISAAKTTLAGGNHIAAKISCGYHSLRVLSNIRRGHAKSIYNLYHVVRAGQECNRGFN